LINIELDVITAAAVRESLFRDTQDYTYDPTCCPQRVVDIRNVIVNLDTQIEEELQKAVTAIKESDETSNT
jgi:hypothetical protein